MTDDITERAKHAASSSVHQIGVKSSHYIISAMGLVVGLSWNETIKDVISSIYPMGTDSLRARVVYSIILTVALIILVALLPNTKEELPQETRARVERQELEDRIRENRRLLNKINVQKNK